MKFFSIHLTRAFFLISILLMSSCKMALLIKSSGKKAVVDNTKIIRFEKFITNSSNLSCGISLDKKLFCNEQKVENGVSLFELTTPTNWPVKSIETGRGHVCGVFEGPAFDEIWCKGTGTSGQLGDGLNLNSSILVKVSGLPSSRFIDIGSGNLASCAVAEDKKVYCWGTGYFPTGVSSPSPTAILTPFTNVNEIKGNYASFCALKDDKTLWCWGSGSNGILGQGNATNSYYTPRQVKDSAGTGFLQNVTDFAVGYTHTCAIVNEEVYCWGFSRRVGVDLDAATTLPHHIPALSGALKIEAGDYHSCALLKTGEVYCWGQNRSLEISGTEDYLVLNPKKVEFPASAGEIVDLTLGIGTNPTNSRSCALNKKGEVYCWGTASAAIFGNLAPLLAKNFTMQPSSNVSSLRISNTQLCLINNNSPYSSGFNDYAQYTHDRHIISTPLLMGPDSVTDFDCSRYANCYVSNNKLFCQGLSYTGRHEITALGNTVKKAVLGSHSTCALMQNDDLKCWGINSAGQVGNGTLVTPVNITTPYLTLQNVVMAEGGQYIFCAMTSDKKVWCWGSNAVGTVGHDNSSEVNVSTPVLVQGLPDLTSVTKINLKVEHQTACLHADQDVYCWGAGVGTLLSLGTENTFKAYKISELSGNIEKLAIIHMGVCVAYDTNKVSCLTNNVSNLIISDRKEVYKKTYPAIGPIEELEGGAYLLCQVLKTGKLYCLGNNSYGGLAHTGIASPLVLNPEKWLP